MPGRTSRAEAEVRDPLMRALYEAIGVPDSWYGNGASARFTIDRHWAAGHCDAELKLTYDLPNGGQREHQCDILVSYRPKGEDAAPEKYLSIEVKHRSAVTDVFKSRSYDMLHLKQTYGRRLYSILHFARVGKGIGFDQARLISYPFDEFIDVDFFRGVPFDPWEGVIKRRRAKGREDTACRECWLTRLSKNPESAAFLCGLL
jgi:hypothetical protein